ncbi:UNVERIFIED_CONTAM: hypothetical protein Sradi_1221300 [Sesamum radiatum]|uniref:Uncharacterized protein n=1 Tax=Sesamum radiatum TaxID=300843 RepID=A0AAW2UM60_SESRA
MMRCGRCGLTRTVIEAWIRDYDNLQWLAVKLIYAQIACALIGSLAPLYNGVLLVDLGISLFALVAIERQQSEPRQDLRLPPILLRFPRPLLISAVGLKLVDGIYMVISLRTPPEFHGTFLSILVNLTLAMQIVGFSVRLSSSLLWIQMYRLGVSTVDNSGARDTDGDLRNSFLNPATPIVRHISDCDDVYSSLFEDGKDDTYHSVRSPYKHLSGETVERKRTGRDEESSIWWHWRTEDLFLMLSCQIPKLHHHQQ